MSFRREEIRHVARLARIALTQEEEVRLGQDLETILGYIQKLEDVDVSSVPETAGVHANTPSLREDVARRSEVTDAILERAPATVDRHYRVPRILD